MLHGYPNFRSGESTPSAKCYSAKFTFSNNRPEFMKGKSELYIRDGSSLNGTLNSKEFGRIYDVHGIVEHDAINVPKEKIKNMFRRMNPLAVTSKEEWKLAFFKDGNLLAIALAIYLNRGKYKMNLITFDGKDILYHRHEDSSGLLPMISDSPKRKFIDKVIRDMKENVEQEFLSKISRRVGVKLDDEGGWSNDAESNIYESDHIEHDIREIIETCVPPKCSQPCIAEKVEDKYHNNEDNKPFKEELQKLINKIKHEKEIMETTMQQHTNMLEHLKYIVNQGKEDRHRNRQECQQFTSNPS